MKKKIVCIILTVALTQSLLFGCGQQSETTENEIDNATENVTENTTETATDHLFENATQIDLSDESILVNGETASTDATEAVYTGASIIYYEEGQDETYGAGSEDEAHSQEEADQNTVVTISKAGTYVVSGKLSAGQIAVDLGDDASEDESAVVTLILNNADITCAVAPAINVYRVYECGSDDTETASKDIDTSTAGFNLMIADDSENQITGSHVAKIYKEGTTQEEIDNDTAKKAHKYDAAIESAMSFNINAGEKNNGKLTVNADNEGIETQLHMTINGGILTVNANDDSLNAAEDGVSVITINDGILTCDSGYQDGDEGDGIDSNGYIVINGGYTIAGANAKSQDSGVDSDLGIYINGGTLLASGHMYDEISTDSTQQFAVFGFQEDVTEDEKILICDADGNAVTAFAAVNDYNILVYSSDSLTDADYLLYKVSDVTGDLNGTIYTNITDYKDPVQLQYSSSNVGGMGKQGMGNPPENMEMPNGEKPDGEGPNGEKPDGEKPDGESAGGERPNTVEEANIIFSLSQDSYQFGTITEVK